MKKKMMESSRQQKLRQFLAGYAGGSVLDVGVSSIEWTDSINFFTRYFADSDFSREYVGLGIQDLGDLASKYSGLTYVQYGGGRFPFQDQSFEWVFSNAVIEHVGDRADQLYFLQEMLRVGRNVFFTTPNRYFPIELHTNVPLFHILLSKAWFDRFLIRVGKSFATGDYMHLLSKKDILSLLNEVDMSSHMQFNLIQNRILGFVCTFSVIVSHDCEP